MSVIGIDNGTTFSKVAYLDSHGTPTSSPNSRGEHSTPSWVYAARDGSVMIGTDAIEQAAIDPDRVAKGFKLQLGTTDSVLPADGNYTATDATADVLQYLVDCAANHTGEVVTDVVITVPANFRDDAKQALKEAAERIGLNVLLLMAEPTAAAFAYAANKKKDGACYAIYDFGGGTFDVSIVRQNGSELTVLATEGVPKLGGNDLTRCLEQRVLAEVERVCGTRPDPATDGMFFLDLWQKLERAKASLANQAEVPVVVAYNGQQVIVRITAKEFHADIMPLVAQSLEATDQAVAAAGLSFADLDRLVMVGGTSRIPFIQEQVADHTGMVPRCDIDPEKAVAYGAALAAVAELAKQNQTVTLRGQAIPSPDLFVRDVLAHDVGCCVVEPGSSGTAKRLVNSKVVAKNTPIPCRIVKTYKLEFDDQREAQIEILQGPDGAEYDDCTPIGELRLLNLPPEKHRSDRIEIVFDIDANGMVTVIGSDTVSGQSQTISVDYKHAINHQGRKSAA